MSRNDHPNKEIREAVDYALEKGWRLRKGTGHAWGRLYCPRGERGGCIMSVHSTPGNPQKHAKAIINAVDACRCPHR